MNKQLDHNEPKVNVQYFNTDNIGKVKPLPAAGKKSPDKPAIEIGNREDNMTSLQKRFTSL
jgi:hypothetical protein